MHLLVEVWIPAFTIILNAKWLNLALVQNTIHREVNEGDGGEAETETV